MKFWLLMALCLLLPWAASSNAYAASHVDCVAVPTACSEPDEPRKILKFKLEIKKKKLVIPPRKKAVVVKKPKVQPKPTKAIVAKKNSKPIVKPLAFAPVAKKLTNSWDGLPEIPVVALLSQDMTDIAGQFIVDFNPEAFSAAGLNLQTIATADLAIRLGLSTDQIRSVQRRFLFSAVLLSVTPEQAAALAQNQLVREVHADTQIKAAGERRPISWGLDRLDGPSLPLDGSFDREFGDYDARIYLFDTAVLRDHREFSKRVTFGAQFIKPPLDKNQKCREHGTEMASLLAGETTGAAPRAEIVELVVLPCARRDTGEASGLIEAVEWLLIREKDFGDGKPVLANMSLTGKWSRKINSTVAVLTENGVAVVVAAGNNAQDACRYSPASARDAITVGATGPNDETPGFSNFGKCVDIHAPGRLLTALTDNEQSPYVAINGTSGATALVSGLLARSLRAKGPAAASQWLVDAAVPAKFWRTDKLDIRLAQTSSNWRNLCRIADVAGGLTLHVKADAKAKVTATLRGDTLVTVQKNTTNWVRLTSTRGETGWMKKHRPEGSNLLQLDRDLNCTSVQ